jgi:hypothetical protein
VHRREPLVAGLVASDRHAHLDYRFGELLASALTLAAGKMHCVEELYLVRTDTPAGLTRTNTGGVMRPWAGQVVAADFSARYTRFKGALVEALGGGEVAARAVDDGFVAFLSTRLGASAEAAPGLPVAAMQAGRRGLRALRSAGRHLGRPLLRDLRAAPLATYRELAREPTDELTIGRLCSPSSRYRDDFQRLYSLIEGQEL